MSRQILIVEDDLSFKKILEVRIKSFIPDVHIFHFTTLADARNFLKTVKIDNVDLIILDEHLTDGRGRNLLEEGWFENHAVLSVSSDDAPEIAGETVRAGAAYFLRKDTISQQLFEPLVRGLIERNELQKEFNKIKVDNAIIDTVKTLISTLQHEINNPLGAVIGAAYILRNNPNANEEQKHAAALVEESSQRIKHVIKKLGDAIEVQPVNKANQKVFHIPGDKPWEE